MNKKQFAFVGPLSGQVTGQRIAFEALLSLNGCFFDILDNLNILKILFRVNRFSGIYITGSRSYLGFLRDSLFLFPFIVFNKKIIIHIHGDDLDYLLFSKLMVFSRISRFVYKRSLIISCNPDQFKRYSKDFKLHLIENFSRFEIQKVRNSKSKRFIYLSTISLEKGIFDWLEIIEEIGPNYEFDIIGDFDLNKLDYAKFNHYINRLLALNYRVNLHGRMLGEELSEFLNIATDLIFISKHPTENMPLVLLEAAAKGLKLHVTVHRNLNLRFGLKTNAVDLSFSAKKLAYNILNSSDIFLEYNQHIVETYYSKSVYIEKLKSVVNN
ncbi:MAG: glycosyltransferase [Bacteroidia bacterium]|nr:glycosyltransferase [Bacteroidia bacterium]